MAKKFINWDNLEYIIESMQKFLIDHNGLDNHLDVFWEARERVTDNMKYGRDITGCAYTKDQYERLINPETSQYLEGTFVGVAEKNKAQDDRMTTIEAKDTEQDGKFAAIEAKNAEQDGKFAAIESKNAEQDIAIGNKANASDVYTKSQTDSKIAEAKKSILTGETTEQLNESYDTLLEIHKWIVSHGQEATNLLGLITSLSSRVEEIENNGAGVDPNTTAKINDLRRVLDEIAHVAWDDEAWRESAEATGESTGEATEDVTETPTEDVTETPTEDVTETPTEDVTETPTEDVTETPTEDVTETPTEDVTETPTEDVTETPTEDVTETPTEDVTETPTQLDKLKVTPDVSYSTSVDTITLTFAPNDNIEKYTIWVGEMSTQTSSDTYTITNLNPDTEYTVIVEATPKDTDKYENGSVELKITTSSGNNDQTEDIGVDDATKMTMPGGGLEDPGENINNTLDEALENA